MNDQELLEHLRRGRAAAADLAPATEALTEALAAFERDLSELGWGVTADVPLDPPTSPRSGSAGGFRLRFGKVGKVWRLTVETPAGTQLLINSSRESRMLAAQRLGELVGALADAVADNAAGVRAARHAAEALTGLLNSAPLER